MIPDNVPLEQREQFELMMHSLTVMEHQQTPTLETEAETAMPEEQPEFSESAENKEQETTSSKISKGILIGQLEIL